MRNLRCPTARAKRQAPTCLAVIQLLGAFAYLAAINIITALAAILILGLGHVVARRDIIECESEKQGWCEEKIKCEAGGSRFYNPETRIAVCLKTDVACDVSEAVNAYLICC